MWNWLLLQYHRIFKRKFYDYIFVLPCSSYENAFIQAGNLSFKRHYREIMVGMKSSKSIKKQRISCRISQNLPAANLPHIECFFKTTKTNEGVMVKYGLKIISPKIHEAGKVFLSSAHSISCPKALNRMGCWVVMTLVCQRYLV